MSSNEIVQSFLSTYYNSLQSNRSQMGGYYRESSTLTYEGDERKGIKSISDKFNQLSFQNIQFQFENHDFQSSLNGLIVAVNGRLLMDNENQFKFFQVFQISQDQQGFYIANDIFRLILS